MIFTTSSHPCKLSESTEAIEEDGIRGAGEAYIVVTVQNKGGRPVTITDIRARLLKGDSMNLQCKPPVPAELSEDQYILGAAEDEELDLGEVAAFEAHRAIGRPYTKSVAPLLTRMRWYLKKKR
jgi:hypothetical protein